jgi:hypothetical protein
MDLMGLEPCSLDCTSQLKRLVRLMDAATIATQKGGLLGAVALLVRVYFCLLLNFRCSPLLKRLSEQLSCALAAIDKDLSRKYWSKVEQTKAISEIFAQRDNCVI